MKKRTTSRMRHIIQVGFRRNERTLYDKVEAQARAGGYASITDYVRLMIRQGVERYEQKYGNVLKDRVTRPAYEP